MSAPDIIISWNRQTLRSWNIHVQQMWQ